MKKNDIIRLEITDVTSEGSGIGRHEGMAVFVPFTAAGDVIDCRIVKVLSSYAYGIVETLVSPSPFRCDDGCGVYKKCGGCAFRHFSYEEELAAKARFVEASFSRIGKLTVDWDSPLGCDKLDGYRNKAQYPVGTDADGHLIAGFYSRRSHRVTDGLICALQPPVFGEIVRAVLAWCEENHIPAYDEITGKGLLRHIYLRRGEHTGEIMLCLVVTDTDKQDFAPLAETVTAAFPAIKSVILNENAKNTNVILGKTCRTVWGSDTITDTMCGRTFRISPLSFYQVNTRQAERLYGIAREYAALEDGETLLDLYCGIGTIGLSVVGENNRLVGVEIIPSAIENAKANAALNGIENAEFFCGDAGEIAKKLIERGEVPDVIIADPARKGCDALSIESMLKMAPKRIVMISCNHATAARDCAELVKGGYRIEKGRAVDLFPRTTHVECVVLLTRKDIDEHV